MSRPSSSGMKTTMTMPNASVSGTSTTATTSTDNTQQQQHDTHQHLHEVEQPDNFEQGSSWTQITAMQAIVEDPLYAPCRDVIMRYGRCNSSLVRKFSGGCSSLFESMNACMRQQRADKRAFNRELSRQRQQEHARLMKEFSVEWEEPAVTTATTAETSTNAAT